MSFLLDTHALLWWLFEPARLSPLALETMKGGGNRLYWSAASTWEAAIKVGLGRLTLPGPARLFFPKILEEEGLIALPVNHGHAAAVADLPPHHRDPFDRLLVAQAQFEELALLSADPSLRLYDVKVVW
ncbi:MAG: type II toxin-antitoxin system VapC family toxin [Candidatus Riflebacteria bacterium]|nr:type II toxin-antitoxin system VapC family toxin [Candidatus Riflebacteria bacterium]